MQDTRTNKEKEQSPYFSHWEFQGNELQKALHMGPKEAQFGNFTEAEAQQFADGVDEGSSTLVAVTTAPEFVEVIDDTGAKKAITLHQWMLDYAEQSRDSKLGRLYKRSPWAYRCVQIKSKALAALPWGTFKKDKQDDDSDFHRRLKEVNPEMNFIGLIESTGADLDIYGKAYWLKGTAEETITFLQRLNPLTMEEIVDPKHGLIGFKQNISQGASKKFKRAQIVYFHLYDPTYDFGGISPLQASKSAIQVEIRADEHLAEFFANRAMPDYIFSMQTTNANELKRVADGWKRNYQGKGNQHKTGWVGGDAKPFEMGYAPEKLALKDVRAEARREICGAFGVPAALAGAWEAANFATMREQRKSLYVETMIPLAKYMEGVINAELAPDFEGGFEFRWIFQELSVLQEDMNDKAKRMAWLVEAGIIKREVAAVAIGFEASDVPDELPVPKSSDNNNQSAQAADVRQPLRDERKTTSDKRQTLSDKTEDALRKWRRKALNRLKDGKQALCDFNSQYVDETLGQAIKGQLEEAENADEVTAVFEGAVLWRNYP